MRIFHHSSIASVLLAVLIGRSALAGTAIGPKVVQEPASDSWQFKLAAPIWVAGVEGKSGFSGHVLDYDVSAKDLLRRVDMTAALQAEASKGRFGLMGEFLYLSLSDGVGPDQRITKKVDFQLDQTVGDLALRWRLVEGQRGWVDFLVGGRYTSLYQKMAFQPNNERIDEVAHRLAVAGTGVRALALRQLLVLSGYSPQLPNAPLNAEQAEKLAKAVGAVKGNTAEREQKIAKILRKAASQTYSRVDDWFDSYVGLRAQYNLNASWYLIAKGDIGGFGVGSDLTWQTTGALGWHFAKNAYAELGYRAVGVDYQDDGFTYDVVTHGAELTLGVNF